MGSPAPRIASNEGVIDAVKAALGDDLLAAVDAVGEVSFTVRRDAIVEVMRTLRDQFDYQQLMEIAGVDYPGAARAVRGRLSPAVADQEPPHPRPRHRPTRTSRCRR